MIKKIMFLVKLTLLTVLLVSCIDSNEKVTVEFIVEGYDEYSYVEEYNVGEVINILNIDEQLDNHYFLNWTLNNKEEVIDELTATENIKLYANLLEKTFYVNPLYDKSLGDPHIIRHEDAFYIFATSVGILKSKDLINWEEIGHVFEEAPNWGAKGANVWAPDIVKIKDKFILYYSLSVWGDENPGIGIAVADHPEGPWTDNGKLFQSSEIGVNNSIDAGVFVAEDEKVYMFWGSFKGLYAVELEEDGLSLKGGIEYANENKKLIGGYETSDIHYASTYEAVYVEYIDGYYYMFVSSGNCCEGLDSSYNVRVARSKDPLGPYIDSNGKDMYGENRGHQVIRSSAMMVGPGHNSIIKDDFNNYWIVYHVFKNKDGETKGRQLAIDKLIFDEQGWPSVLNEMPTYRKQEGPVIIK